MKFFLILVIVVYILAVLSHTKSPFADIAYVITFYAIMRYTGKICKVIFFDERIQWPDALSNIKKLYFALAKAIAILLNGGTAYLLLLLIYKLFSGIKYDILDFWCSVLLLAAYLLFACCSTFFECWCLHDRWAEQNDSLRITTLMDERIKGSRKPSSYDWLFFDVVLVSVLFAFINKSSNILSLEEWLLCAGIWLIMLSEIIFHLWLWCKYKDV
ncbi:hypothetical protein [Phascolarctobacterium succinatutens]|uniref:hypothetical protein n=1 Tax=Phascolarctobacterium succinatutens TaxID=626940 RepID=UPI0026F32626|nr:hypothetical protein [Phascolarctobacterium succinatutens]MBS5426468.1 hypothetical protein [Phascolarctobacterium succinatutens]